jgi:hypothetical protein
MGVLPNVGTELGGAMRLTLFNDWVGSGVSYQWTVISYQLRQVSVISGQLSVINLPSRLNSTSAETDN